MNSIIDHLVHLMESIGAPGAGIAVAVENFFPPIPSEAILPLAGFTAARGSFTLAEALLWTTAGSLVGALVLYLLGRWVGADRLRRWAERLSLVRAADVGRAVAWFERRGALAVLIGRMIPVFRSVISIPAGVTKMSPPLFITLTAVGSALWNGVFVGAGYALAANWQAVEPIAGVLEKVVLALILVAVVVFGWRRIIQLRRSRSTVERTK